MLNRRYLNDGQSIVRLNIVQQEAKKNVEEKLERGQYVLEEVLCPVCRGPNFELLSEKDRYGLPLAVVICKQCGLIQSNPRMDVASYAEFYNLEYRRLYGGTSGPTDGFFQHEVEKGQSIFQYIKENNLLPERGKLIVEVGCGAGGVLKVFKDAGYHVMGVDLGAEYVEYGRKQHGLDLFVGTFADMVLDSAPDCVIYADVLEHILDPNSELALLKTKIHAKTLVFISMPSVKGLIQLNPTYRMDFLRLLQNAHVWHFTLRSLNNLMSVNGYRLVAGNERIYSLFSLNQTQENWISDYNAVMTYLRRLEYLRDLFPIKPYHIVALQAMGISGVFQRIMRKLNRN